MLTIRQATIEDLESLQQLNHEIMVNNKIYDADFIADFDLTPEGEAFFIESIQRKDGCCLMAELEGQMVGYCDGGHKNVPARKSRYFEIDNLGVIPEVKGQGIGRKLMDAVTSWAKEHGYQKIYLNCYFKNEEAIAFYRKNGFEEIDICLEKKI